MTVTVKHSKTNAISDWTQAQLDEQIALGNFAEGTVLADIVLPSDWNDDHTLTGVGTMAEQNANSVAITGGSINGTTIGATTPSTGKFTSVTTPSVTATTNDLTLSAISTGAVKFSTAGGLQMQVADKASAVDYLQITGGAASQAAVFFTTQGTDTNIGYDMRGKGAGTYWFSTGSAFAPQMTIANTASAVNYVQVTGAATGGGVTLSAQGSDANVSLTLRSKGSNEVTLGNGNTFRIFSALGASGTNYPQTTSSATGQAIQFASAGTDTNISMAFQPKGTGAIDLAAGSSGVNISNGGTVTAITRTALGTSYTSPPTVNISAPTTAGGVQATATVPLQQISPMTIVSGGTGYTVGDTLTVSGGTWSVTPTMTVATVSGGVITSITQVNYGVGTVIPSNPISVTGGTGTGATFSTTAWGIGATFTITNAGSGYIEQPTVTFSGGGGSGASAYATVGSQAIIKGIGTSAGTISNQSIMFQTPAGNSFLLRDAGTATPDAHIMTQATANGYALFMAEGSNTNASLYVGAKGSGSIRFNTNSTSLTEQLRVSHTASAVNYVQVTGSATGSRPTISSQGSDTTLGLNIQAKGTSNINFLNNSGSNTIFVVSGNAGTIANYLQATGSVAGSAVSLQSQGTDTNIDLSLTTKGTGAVNLNTGGGTQFRVVNTASAVNYFQANGGATGVQPGFRAEGSDTNISTAFTTKGTGGHFFSTNGFAQTQFVITHTASAVNYVQVTGSATSIQPVISAQGSDANIGLVLTSKGANNILFRSNNNANTQFTINGGTASVNNLQVAGATAGSSPILSAIGSDTNIDIALTPKGTGVVQFGTHTANADTAISGYITIRDAGGTLRKLAVIT